MPVQAQPRHGDCAYFANGFCTLKGAKVSPDDPACPDFVPRAAFFRMWPLRMAFPRFQMPGPRPRGFFGFLGRLGLGLRRRLRHRHRRRHRYGWRFGLG